ncbi:hypothetical protein FH972_021187 [Carpinus fangiana]|uniref:Uncharacterized protein n=1 Tax=Carpinus fangiana TaxID=176857 RepID=A0A5N6KP64_9ROSI|nr:hypothetical protein FH972_021187 [Carpinus fangiana]
MAGKRLKNRSEELDQLKAQLASTGDRSEDSADSVQNIVTAGETSNPILSSSDAMLVPTAPQAGAGIENDAMLDTGIGQSQPFTEDDLARAAAQNYMDLQLLALQPDQAGSELTGDQWLPPSAPLSHDTGGTGSSGSELAFQGDGASPWLVSSTANSNSGSGTQFNTRPPIPKCKGKKMMPILLSIQAAGYDSVDSSKLSHQVYDSIANQADNYKWCKNTTPQNSQTIRYRTGLRRPAARTDSNH